MAYSVQIYGLAGSTEKIYKARICNKDVYKRQVLAAEISPDTCRFWDKETNEKLDKDRFRRDMGNVEDAYEEIMKRLMGETV